MRRGSEPNTRSQVELYGQGNQAEPAGCHGTRRLVIDEWGLGAGAGAYGVSA